jgi:hypothetical protein
MLFALNGTAECLQSQPCATGLPVVTADNGTFTSVLSIVFGIIGALAVLMIVIAGLRFVAGQGTPQENAKARNTIIYATAGLLIALAAEAIVNLVIVHL